MAESVETAIRELIDGGVEVRVFPSLPVAHDLREIHAMLVYYCVCPCSAGNVAEPVMACTLECAFGVRW